MSDRERVIEGGDQWNDSLRECLKYVCEFENA